MLGIKVTKFDQLRNETGPSGLMAGSQARAVISVEILVEQNVILPVRIALEFLRTSINRPPARLILQEYPGQPISNFPGYLEHITRLQQPKQRAVQLRLAWPDAPCGGRPLSCRVLMVYRSPKTATVACDRGARKSFRDPISLVMGRGMRGLEPLPGSRSLASRRLRTCRFR